LERVLIGLKETASLDLIKLMHHHILHTSVMMSNHNTNSKDESSKHKHDNNIIAAMGSENVMTQ